MPEPKELELRFSGWEKEAVKYGDLLQQSSIRLDEVQVAYQKAQKKDVLPAGMSPEELAKWEQKSILGRIFHFPTPPIITVPQERIQLRAQLGTIATDILRYEFYSRLYSVIPAAVMGNEVSSIDEALNIVAPPFGMSEADLNSVREIVQDMLTIQDIDSEPATQPRLPELVKPTERRLAPTTIQKLTIDALVRYMTAPKVPASTLDDSEWNELLLKAHPEYADMTQVEIVEAEAKRIIAESKLANEQMAGFQSAIAEMPDYKLTDFLKEAIMQPGLALLEVAGIYFEKVSQPLAASFYKMHIQDIENLYQKHRIAGDDNWTALQKSWEEWDAPGSGVPEFILKYMLMETLADPLTWLAGFSIGTSIAAGISGASRFVRFAVILNKTNRVIFAPFEAPFTGIKYLVGKLPKTISQRAAIVEGMTGRVVKQWMEQAAGKGKLLNKGMTMKDWDTLARRSVRYTFNNPQSVDPIAEVGRVLLKHEPISRDDLIRYAKRLGLTLTEPDVTPGMLVGVNTIFEAMFQKYGARTGKLMTSKEAGKRFLGVLGLGGADDTTYKKAVSILEARAKNIVNEAYAFAEAASPGKALQHLMKRNFDYHIEIERAMEQFLVSKSGRFNQLYAGVEARFVAIWQKYVEDIMIRPLAQSYLTFAMYGPMNVVEDHWRSILGGVFPRRMDHNRMALLGKGTSLDPDLVNPSLAVSETIGRMARKGGDDQWNNWILQLGGIVPKDWVDKLYTGLVRLPGGFGMDIRRNFVGQKYLVLFKEMGGETLERLYRVETRVGLPKLADKKLVKALRTSIQDAITTLDPEAVRAVGRTFTRKAIQRNEVVGITKEHPDLPNTVRDIFIQSFDDNTLYAQGVRSIAPVMKRANTQLMDDYLKGAGYATKQFQELTNVLTQMEVRNPEEMAHLLYNLNIASDIYGKAPEEILAAATVASQGKNLTARRAHFDQIFDDILEFRDKAGGNLEKLVEKLRVDLKGNVVKFNWGETEFRKNVTPEIRQRIDAIASQLPPEIKLDRVKVIHINDTMQYGGRWIDSEGILQLHSTFADGDLVHELVHANNPGMAEKEVEALGRKIQSGMKSSSEIIKTGITFNSDYTNKSNRLLDLLIAKKTLSDQFRLEDMAWRHELFAGVEAKAMTDEWWQNTYRQMRQRIKQHKTEIVGIEGDIFSALKGVDISAGIQPFFRQPIKVVDRVLAPQDIASLVGAQGDDLSRALLDNLTIVNDRDMFVEYIMRQLRPGDEGFTRESIGEVFDQIARQARVRPNAINWVTSKQMELEAIRGDLHQLYLSKLLPDDEVKEVARYTNEVADGVSDLIYGPEVRLGKVPDYDIGLGERIVTPELVKEAETQKIPLPAGTKEGEKVVDQNYINRIRTELAEAAEQVKTGRTSLGVKSETYTLKDATELWFRESSNDALQIIGKTASQTPEYLAKVRGILREKYPSGYIRIYRGSGEAKARFMEREYTNVTSSRGTALNFDDTWAEGIITGKMIPTAEEQTTIRKELAEWVAKQGEEGKEGAERAIRDSVLRRRELKPILDNVLIRVDDVVSIGSVDESELIIKTGILKQRITKPLKAPTKTLPLVIKPEFANLQTIRQTAMDDAHTWYYKEFTDYTNANAFDAIMKGIFPFWGYESQRWFWLPRSFIRHPGTFTALERWQDNTDYGYIPVAGTSIEYNPYRGTVYGPLTTRLTRRDYPEYYDAWESAEPITEYFDWLSRYGFYPGGHLSIPMSLFGGLEVQAGEALPPIWESPLMLAQIALPKSESVKMLTDHIFSDRFRTYMTIQEVIARGGDGVVISAKLQRNEPLTDEEQSLWDESRRSAGGYSLLFENTGIFRLRHPEKRAVYKAATKYIEEKYNYTEDQQKWLRMHGHRIWDQIGGMSLEDQRILEEMEYFRYSGTIDRLLPGRQQLVLDKLTLAWNDVEKFVDLTIERKTQLELEFLSGQRGPDDYQSQLKRLYSEQQDFIYNKMRDNLDEPLPDGLSPEDEKAFIKEHSVMELEGRRRYNEKWGIPLPVLHPLKELLNLYYSIELKEIIDPETGEFVRDWDTFWTQRKAVENAVPDMWQGEFKTYITKNETRMEAIRRQIYQTYFTKYWWIWDQVLKGYNDTERRLIKEYISLENRGMDLPRQAVIKSTISEKTGNMLISSFRSDVSEARRALRYANPTLDAWLFYWGRTGTFLTPQAEEIYKRISKETGRKVEG